MKAEIEDRKKVWLLHVVDFTTDVWVAALLYQDAMFRGDLVS